MYAVCSTDEVFRMFTNLYVMMDTVASFFAPRLASFMKSDAPPFLPLDNWVSARQHIEAGV